jgi:hypothetical protein
MFHSPFVSLCRFLQKTKRSSVNQGRTLSLEPLEDRSLLSATTADALLGALVAYQSGDKGDTSSPLSKVGYDLASIYACYESADYAGTSYSGVSFALTSDISAMTVSTTANVVLIDVSSVSSDTTTLKTQLATLGFVETGEYGRMVSGWLSIDRIDELASLSEVSVANAVLSSYMLESNLAALTSSTTTSTTSSSTTVSEGVAAMNADIATATYGVDGTGVTVGILSDSFDVSGSGYATDVAAGELPSDVTVLQDSPDGEDEGRAMAQIVYDVAPGADIMFATAYLGQASFAANIEALAAAGCDVICDDVYYYAEPFFQNGVIAQAVNEVVADGVAYFSSAGNTADQSYESAFTAGTTYASGAFKSYGSSSVYFYGGTALDFDTGSGVSNYQTFTLDSGDYILLELQWDELFASVSGTGSTNDVDIYILDSNNRVIAGSVDNNLGADPSEFLFYYNSSDTTQTYKLMIVCASGDLPGTVKYINFGSDMQNLTYATNSSTCVGHANAQGAAAVGAAYYGDTLRYGTAPAVLEYFSSYGGTSLLFADDGTRYSEPLVQDNVDFVAPDGVSTTVSGFESFYGTSAAAPHAAAAAALLLSFNSSLTPDQIYDALSATASTMENPFGSTSYNYAAGTGLIQVDAAIEYLLANTTASAVTTTTITSDHTSGSNSGDEVTFTVTVTMADNTAVSSGNVQLVIDGVCCGSSVALVDGTASITISTLTEGTHRIEALYQSDDLAVYQNSNDLLLLTVGPASNSISGTVWCDANNNALFDKGEAGLAGWVLYIDEDSDGVWDATEQTATTDANGYYTFSGLAAGTYTIREILQTEWTCNIPASLNYYMVTVTAGEEITGRNFGNYPATSLSSISGTVWLDSNSDGVFDSDETGLSGWVVYIDADSNGVLDANETSTTTDSDGGYTFSGLTDGTYVIREVVQSGWSVTSPSEGEYSVTVADGEDVADQDFGNVLATTTTLTTNRSSGSVYGQSVTLTASVAATNSSVSVTGSVQFIVDGSYFGSSVALVNGACSLTTTALSAGTHTIAAVYADIAATGFQSSQATNSLAVTRASLTITADAKYMLAGSALPTFTSTITGLVNGDTVASLTTQPKYSTKATSSSAAGTYSIVVSAASSNYTIKVVAGTLKIYATTNSVFVMPDPLNSTKQALYIFGTKGNDVIQVNSGMGSGAVTVTINGIARGTYVPTSRIIIHGLAGNDSIGVASKVTASAWLYGDAGNDTLWGGGGASLLFGGAGADSLYGTTGRSILFGDAGVDKLTSGTGHAILFGGSSKLSANDVALSAILNEWNSSAAYATRVAHITGTSGGLNGSYFVKASTLADDAAADQLIGNNSAMDLFFKGSSDVLTKKRTGETTLSV